MNCMKEIGNGSSFHPLVYKREMAPPIRLSTRRDSRGKKIIINNRQTVGGKKFKNCTFRIYFLPHFYSVFQMEQQSNYFEWFLSLSLSLSLSFSSSVTMSVFYILYSHCVPWYSLFFRKKLFLIHHCPPLN